MSHIEDKLYKIIAECLNVLIEEFDSGDIDMPEFCAKVERILGNHPISSMSPEMGLEWELTPNGYNFYYVAAGYTATLRASSTEEGKFVHGIIKHIDVDAADPPDDKHQGCGDSSCVSCNPLFKVEFFPLRGQLVSFGALPRDEN